MGTRKSGRNSDGTFGPGNPGKPRGARHKATQAALALLDGEAATLTRKAVEMALEGDTTALRLCLERIHRLARVRCRVYPGRQCQACCRASFCGRF